MTWQQALNILLANGWAIADVEGMTTAQIIAEAQKFVGGGGGELIGGGVIGETQPAPVKVYDPSTNQYIYASPSEALGQVAGPGPSAGGGGAAPALQASWVQNTETGQIQYMTEAEIVQRTAAGEPWVPTSAANVGGQAPVFPGQPLFQTIFEGKPVQAIADQSIYGYHYEPIPAQEAAGRTTLTAIPYPDGTMHTVLLNVDTGDVVKDYGSATPSGTPYEMAQQIIRKHAGSPEAKAPGAIVDEIQKAVDAAYGPGASAQTIFARGPTEAGGMYNPAAAQAIGQQQGTTNLGVGMLGPLAAGSVSGNIVMGGDVSRYTGTPEQQEAVMTAAGQRPFQTRLSPYGELITTLNLAEAAGRGVAAGTLPATSGLGAAVTATPPLRTAMAPAPLPTGGSIGQLARAVNQPTAGAAAPSAGGPIGAAARAVNQPPSLGIGGLQRAYRPRRRPGEGVFASLAAAGRTIGQFG